MKRVFDYINYQDFILDILQARRPKLKQNQLAQAAGCQPAYLTRVLKKEADLSVDQLLGIADYLDLPQDDVDFLIQLLMMSKSASAKGKNYFKKQIDVKIKRQNSLDDKMKGKKQLQDEVKNYYYSSWIISAIHVATSIPEYQTKANLKKALNISNERLTEILDFLKENKLIVYKEDKYALETTNVFLKKDDNFINRHHQNWRIRAMQSLESVEEEDFHYSTVYSISSDDVLKIKKNLIEQVANIMKIVEPSKEEKIFALTMDFFNVLP